MNNTKGLSVVGLLFAGATVGLGAACSLALFTDPPVDDDGGTGDADGAADADADGDADADADGDADAESDGDGDADGSDDSGGGGRPVGAFCNLAEQCADGLVPGECLTMVWSIDAPEGYCTGIGCLHDEDCPGGAVEAECVEMYAGIHVCLDRCVEESDCRAGYHCLDPDRDGPATPACLSYCSDAMPCPADQLCDVAGDPPLCHEPPGTARPNGDPCAHHAECGAGSYCLAERALLAGWPRGYCTQDCQFNADCTNGGACILACVDDDGNILTDACDDDTTPGTLDPNNAGLCMATCTRFPDTCSRPGYTCQALGMTRLREQDACGPNCRESATPCGEVGWTCDPSAGTLLGGSIWGAGRCQPPLDTAALGEPCAATTGCRGGTCLAEPIVGYPGGLCTEECGPADLCPAGFTCTGAGLFNGFCFQPCTAGDGTCRSGTECQDLGWGVTTCAPSCGSNADCANTCCSQDATGYCDPRRENCMM